MKEPYQKLDYAEQWIADGFRVVGMPGGFTSVNIDMTNCKLIIEKLRQQGVKATYFHLFVRAAALTLTRHPDLHRLVAGKWQIKPENVDIGISVAGATSFAPVMVLKDANQKNLKSLVIEIISRIPEIKQEETQNLTFLRRWGWLIPISWVRQAIISYLLNRIWFRRKLTGTFQVSTVPSVDLVVGFAFNTAGCLTIGRVSDRPVVVDGQIMVRPLVTASCCFDHKVWDGMSMAKFHSELIKILEGGELEKEID